MTESYDLVLDDVRIIDGTGAPAYAGQVGVRDGVIALVRACPSGTPAPPATRVLAGAGRTVTPGFIDLHSHADFTLETHPGAVTQLTQGVTTLLTGNCGSSPFPVRDLPALRTASEFLRPELSWEWRDAAGFGKAIADRRPAVNVAMQVGHGALRLAAMGGENRPPSSGELSTMYDLLAAAAEQGVSGLSTGLIYAPGSFADSAEVTELARVAARYGLLYSTHLRSETDHVLDAVGEAVTVARRTGVRLEISHLKAMGPRNHGKVRRALDLIAAARDEGVDVTTDVYPYTASSTTLTSRLPGWALDGGVAALLDRLADHADARRIEAALAERFAGEIDPAGIVLSDMPEGPYTPWVGRSLVEIASETGREPAWVALDVLRRHRGAVAIVNHAMAAADLDAAIADPDVAIASDGWILAPTGEGRPHPRSFGTFARVLGHYVRERGLLTLEAAVRKMTSLPAERAGLTDRGRVAEGLAADLAVLDPGSVRDRATYDNPWQLSEGVRAVLVNGRLAVADGEPTGERAGALLRPAPVSQPRGERV